MTRILAIFVLAVHLVIAPAALAQQPERVDLAMMARIRDEGFSNSKVMETLAYLTDVLGPRLTASPEAKKANEWTRQQLESWGLQNAHLEPWGPFGRGWTMERVSVHMTAPQYAPLVAVPEAWSPGTNGVVRGQAIQVLKAPDSDAELAQWKGKLAGKVVFLGAERKLEPLDKPLANRYSHDALHELAQFDIPSGRPRYPFNREQYVKQLMFRKTLNQFLMDEKVLAVVEPSPWDRGVIRVGGTGIYSKDEPAGAPRIVMAIEHFNRIVRLLERKQEVSLELDVKATFHDADLMGYNTVAEIPGTDKKNEIVMAGAHLDSWHAGTGATDNGAGVAVVMEAVRILKALGVQPRRTIRVALWTGEEQGLHGSREYVKQHFASRPEPTDPAQKALPSFLREGPPGPLSVKPDHASFSAYFNLDNGTGMIRGVYSQGNAAMVPIFKAWLEPFHDLGATTVTMRDTGGTDHLAFYGVGLPGFQFIQDAVEYSSDARGLTHHSNMDVYDRIQRQDMMQASVIMAAFLYNAAMRDEKLPRKAMPK